MTDHEHLCDDFELEDYVELYELQLVRFTAAYIFKQLLRVLTNNTLSANTLLIMQRHLEGMRSQGFDDNVLNAFHEIIGPADARSIPAVNTYMLGVQSAISDVKEELLKEEQRREYMRRARAEVPAAKPIWYDTSPTDPFKR